MTTVSSASQSTAARRGREHDVVGRPAQAVGELGEQRRTLGEHGAGLLDVGPVVETDTDGLRRMADGGQRDVGHGDLVAGRTRDADPVRGAQERPDVGGGQEHDAAAVDQTCRVAGPLVHDRGQEHARTIHAVVATDRSPARLAGVSSRGDDAMSHVRRLQWSRDRGGDVLDVDRRPEENAHDRVHRVPEAPIRSSASLAPGRHPMSPKKTGPSRAPSDRRSAAVPSPRRDAAVPSPRQSAAMPSPFPPIAEYAFLSDCHTGALVAPDGSVDWLCVPRFDAASVFGSLLDREAGSFRFGPFGINVPTAPWLRARDERARDDVEDAVGAGSWCGTPSPSGPSVAPTRSRRTPDRRPTRTPSTCSSARPSASTAVSRWSSLRAGVRLRAVTGHVDARGRGRPLRRRHAAPAHRSACRPTWRVGIEGSRVRARHVLEAGRADVLRVVVGRGGWSPCRRRRRRRARIDATRDVLAAAGWTAPASLTTAIAEPIQRSALAIKGLTLHADRRDRRRARPRRCPRRPAASGTGTTGTAGCATRPSRCRPSTGSTWTGRPTSSCSSSPTSSPTRTAACRSCTASTAGATCPSRRSTHLSGYAGARPVRVGNGAFDQRQNDVYGAVLDAILLHTARSQRLPRRLWPIVQAQAECATHVWREPDQGIWEARGEPQHYVSSKLMCWVALDRAAKLADLRGADDSARKWQETADDIRADILEHGVSDRGVLRQHYDTDASTRRRCWRRCSASCPVTTSACATPCWPSPTS